MEMILKIIIIWSYKHLIYLLQLIIIFLSTDYDVTYLQELLFLLKFQRYLLLGNYLEAITLKLVNSPGS